MNTNNRSPKILPWLAHKAGISEHRAEILWLAARRHATHATGETETPAFWQAAMDRLLELVVAESLREDAASYGWRRWTRMNLETAVGQSGVVKKRQVVEVDLVAQA